MKLLEKILSGGMSEDQTIRLLTEISDGPLSVELLSEFHEVLSERMIAVDLKGYNLIDLCGTGGDGKNTFNISTAAAFVVAGAGIYVAKHGNYSASSICGSSNVLEELGVKFTSDKGELQKQLEATNICILHAPLFHPALKALAPIRKKIGKRTIFNLLGPLLNPARPRYQLVGVSSHDIATLYSNFFKTVSIDYTIAYSTDGYDEISLTGDFVLVKNTGEENISPKQLYKPEDLLGAASIKQNAEILLSVLNNQASVAKTEVVVINAAYAIRTILPGLSVEDATQMARESLLSKGALKALQGLRNL